MLSKLSTLKSSLENVSENEAIEQAKAQINCRDIEADDEEVLIDDMDIHD